MQDTLESTQPLIIEMKNIVKRFPGVIALNQVNFQLRAGEVHVLLGENGAGKSTLIKVLSGAYVADEGDIIFDGEKKNITIPQDSLDLGIRFIYQELSLVPDLDIARNMFLGIEPMISLTLGLVNEEQLYQHAKQLLQKLHIKLDPAKLVNWFSVTYNKVFETIARALKTNRKGISLNQSTDVPEPILSVTLGLINEKKLYKQAKELLVKFHIELNPSEKVRKLSVTQQKMVEIARALTTHARVIVLDEPTDVLEHQSRNDLFHTIHQLKREQNVSFVYISHRYGEVAEIGDRVTILRDSKNVGTYNIKELGFNRMIELMIGGEIKRQYPDIKLPSQENALRVENLKRKGILDGVSLIVKKGEIVGVTGLIGAGKTELGRAIAGVDLLDEGDVYINEKKVDSRSPKDGIKNGIAYLPEDRKSLGLIQDQSIRDNYAYPNLERLSFLGLVKHSRINTEINDYMSRLSIKAPTMYSHAQQLSGGNQQKVVVAKWLGTQCKVLIFDEPTRGIDINGKREIYKIMKELLEQGVGILMLTSDYAEALEMSHRIVIMRQGKIASILDRGKTSEADILRESIGAVKA